MNFKGINKSNKRSTNVMVWSGQRTVTQAAKSVKMETTAGVCSNQVLFAQPQTIFSTHPKSSRARIAKRTARAARNTHYRYNQNRPLDHKMADNCVSLARTNTVSSTITKPIKIYNKSGKRGLRLSINRFIQLNHH